MRSLRSCHMRSMRNRHLTYYIAREITTGDKENNFWQHNMMHSLLVLSQIAKVFPQHVSRNFTLYMLFVHSFLKFHQNLVFISSIQKYFSYISFYPPPQNNGIVILFFKRICDGEHCFIQNIPFHIVPSFLYFLNTSS